MAKNTICLWYEREAEEAARFYAKTFPQSSVGAVHRAPGDYPDGKAGDALTVDFTVAGIPCIGLNGGPQYKHTEAFSFQIATDDQAETDRYWNAIVGKWRAGKRVRLVQRQVGRFLANHAARADSLSVFNWCRLFSSSANNNENAGGQGLRDRSRSCLKGGWAMLEKSPPTMAERAQRSRT